jgi:hypothetical protein
VVSATFVCQVTLFTSERAVSGHKYLTGSRPSKQLVSTALARHTYVSASVTVLSTKLGMHGGKTFGMIARYTTSMRCDLSNRSCCTQGPLFGGILIPIADTGYTADRDLWVCSHSQQFNVLYEFAVIVSILYQLILSDCNQRH